MLTFTLVIKSDDMGRSDQEKDIEWRVREAAPRDAIESKVEVLSVVADRRELDYLNDTFTNLPSKKDGSVIWRGELAQFIWDNL